LARPKTLGAKRYVWGFSVALLVLPTAVTVGVFAWIQARTTELVQSTVLEQARSYADLIIAARAWNAAHKGVWVEKSAEVTTNPYLAAIGVHADDALSDGTPVTLRNPAAMTREIADTLPFAANGSVFKLTSLRPVNPDNAPDAWERAGLVQFERGTKEHFAVTGADSAASSFRYMRPLVVEANCLTCHARQGYQVGDIRGAISIRLSYASAARSLVSNRTNLIAITIAVLVGLWVAVGGLLAWLQQRLTRANETLQRMATIDPLTGLWNRATILGALQRELERSVRSGLGAGVVLLDIDHFKRVNDRFGHAVGDEVLRRCAKALSSEVRGYDMLGRIGGEELLVVVPNADPGGLAGLAERLRASVAAVDLSDIAAKHELTVSAGTALARPGVGETSDTLVARADDALYKAKSAGRDRVVAG